jgi:hypothetical protein
VDAALFGQQLAQCDADPFERDGFAHDAIFSSSQQMRSVRRVARLRLRRVAGGLSFNLNSPARSRV